MARLKSSWKVPVGKKGSPFQDGGLPGRAKRARAGGAGTHQVRRRVRPETIGAAPLAPPGNDSAEIDSATKSYGAAPQTTSIVLNLNLTRT